MKLVKKFKVDQSVKGADSCSGLRFLMYNCNVKMYNLRIIVSSPDSEYQPVPVWIKVHSNAC